MSKHSIPRLFLFLCGVIAVMGGAALLKGGFYIGKHEGDTLHLAEMVLRMADGQRPHLDFMTPIGILAMAPLSIFVGMGAGLGHSIFYAQILVALILLPAVLWIGRSRLTGVWPYVFGGYVMVLCLALVHGEAERSVSISMHYNRWSWAVSYVVLALVMLTPLGARRPVRDGVIDGVLIGLCMAALILIKVTYFIALMPAVLIALMARRMWVETLSALVAGLCIAAIVTVLAGVEFWFAYLADLRTVAGSEIRPQPGESFAAVVAAPPFMGASMMLIALVIFLRQSARSVEGMILLFVMPGFFYITFQNFGNDPQWLVFAGILAFFLRPDGRVEGAFGMDLRQGLAVLGTLAFAFGTASVLNLVYSPFRHLAADTDRTVPLIASLPQHQDILTTELRIYSVEMVVAGDGKGSPYATYREKFESTVAEGDAGAGVREDTILNGEVLAECEIRTGMAAWFTEAARDLEAAGYGGARLLATDLFSSFWLYGDFTPVQGAAPWYYGGLSGVENADYLVVPICPLATNVRAGMLKSLEEQGWSLREVRRTPVYILIEATAA